MSEKTLKIKALYEQEIPKIPFLKKSTSNNIKREISNIKIKKFQTFQAHHHPNLSTSHVHYRDTSSPVKQKIEEHPN